MRARVGAGECVMGGKETVQTAAGLDMRPRALAHTSTQIETPRFHF